MSLEQNTTSVIKFRYERGVLGMEGTFHYDAGVKIANFILFGADATTVAVNKPLTRRFRVVLG